LSAHDPRLAALGAQAGRYFREDPPTTIFKLRQLTELLAKLIAARHAVYRDDREAFEETLRRLSYDRIPPREAADATSCRLVEVFDAWRDVFGCFR